MHAGDECEKYETENACSMLSGVQQWVGASQQIERKQSKYKLKLKSELHSAKNVLKQMEINKIFRQATGEQAAD